MPQAAKKSPSPLRALRPPLSVERIAEAALALIDAQGLEQFSMRRLGQDLGVEAMALYHHLPSKGRVLDAVMERLLVEFDIPGPGSMAPMARLRHAVQSYRQIAIRHPNAFVLLVARRFNSAGAFAVYERFLQVFADLGLNPAQTARWFRTLGYFLNGAGMADIASREQVPNATPLTLEHAPDQVLLPHVAAVAPYLRVERLDEVFDFGLEMLLTALAWQPKGSSPGSSKLQTGRKAATRSTAKA